MSSFFNMDSPIMRRSARLYFEPVDYCLLYPGIYSRSLYHGTVFCYPENGQGRGILYRKRFLQRI